MTLLATHKTLSIYATKDAIIGCWTQKEEVTEEQDKEAGELLELYMMPAASMELN